MTGTLLRPEEERLARVARRAPRIPWEVFTGEHFHWKHGEHVALIGPTGQGKTTLLQHILPMHPYVTIFITKPRDTSADKFIRAGYVKMDRWHSVDPRIMPRRVLWPDASKLGAADEQKRVFHDAFQRIYTEGAWTVVVDELWYISNRLRLSADVEEYLSQARSIDISMVNLTQRPAWVPTMVYDQSTHLFFWRNNDARAQQRLGEINAIDSDLVRYVVGHLERHQVLYIDTRTGAMVRTRCPATVGGRVPV
jgi:energy-coupling factor transporter ATP-binding protein EcfA2